MFDQRDLQETTLDAQLAAAASSFTAVSNGLDDFPTTGEINNGLGWACFVTIDDEGVTQADPEMCLFQGAFSGTLGQLRQRGFNGTSVPANWPVGSRIRMVNTAEVINMLGANTLAYSYWVEGHINGTPGATGQSGIRFYANGSALPSAVDAMAFDVDPAGWDMGNYFANFAAGDLLRIRWLSYDMGTPTSAAGEPGSKKEIRFEAKIDSVFTDNGGNWSVDIDNATVQFHGDITDSSAGIQGMVLVDLVKLV